MRTREEIEKKLINSVKDAHAYTPEERDMRILNIGVHNGLEILLDIRDLLLEQRKTGRQEKNDECEHKWKYRGEWREPKRLEYFCMKCQQIKFTNI